MQNGQLDQIYIGDSREILQCFGRHSVDLSVWSPPYFVGKSYEQDLSFEDWQSMLSSVIEQHSRVIRPGGFLAINIADILCFEDPSMPRFQAENVCGKTNSVTRRQVMAMQAEYPTANRIELAQKLGCSEQTVQRRIDGNNVRGGKTKPSTKIVLTGCMVAEWASASGFYLYDQRIWHKDPCWLNSRWHSNSYRAIDEFEHLYIFWQPGTVQYDRNRLSRDEWSEWGSRGVWSIPSVRRNDRHEAEFPEELVRRVIKLFSPVDGVVLDPFVGSGTTTAVAKSLRRHWLGIDANEEYVHVARNRTNLAS